MMGVKGKTWKSHRIAYILTYGEIPDGLIVRHLCNNKICCNPDHLALGTYQDNSDDMVNAGRSNRGEQNPESVLTEWQVLDISDRYVPRVVTEQMLADEYDVHQMTVSDIITGKTWGHLTGRGVG